MNKKINADLKLFKFIFNKNKPYIFPFVTILITIIFFFQFILPQFNVLFRARKEAGEMSLRLGVFKKNLTVLTNVDEQALDLQLETLNSALPLNKDFIRILNSLYVTAQKIGVDLGGFSISVGDLSKTGDGDSFPVIKLSVPIKAGITAVNNFVEIISKTIPLSEVYHIKIGDVSSMVSLAFYYKPLSASNYSQDSHIIPISQKGLTLLDQLYKFENTSSSLGLIALPLE